jgi:hypothetical protein
MAVSRSHRTRTSTERQLADVTRYVPHPTECELWGRAAGRCEFAGCNRPLYKSPVTQEAVNISEKAHIYAFSKKGPRGRGPFKTGDKRLNKAANLMLVCHDCHRKVDTNPEQYPADLLLQWKATHENRIGIVTGIDHTKKSHVVLYGANIGLETSPLPQREANASLFPNRYPADEQPMRLSMTWEGKDRDPTYWEVEAANLRTNFDRQIRPLISRADPLHFSLFALAPIPLLMLLGSLFTDKTPVDVYQLHREPPTWKWPDGPSDIAFRVIRPRARKASPVLVISLSDIIARDRITSVLGAAVSIWELTIDRPHNDFLNSRDQLSSFRRVVRSLLIEIGQAHGKSTELSIFPAMPIACAVELGRVRMPKAEMPFTIYDQNNQRGGFIRALNIGEANEQ